MLYIKDNRETVPIIVVEMWRLFRIYLLNECKNKISTYYIYLYIYNNNNNKLLYKRWTLKQFITIQ